MKQIVPSIGGFSIQREDRIFNQKNGYEELCTLFFNGIAIGQCSIPENKKETCFFYPEQGFTKDRLDAALSTLPPMKMNTRRREYMPWSLRVLVDELYFLEERKKEFVKVHEKGRDYAYILSEDGLYLGSLESVVSFRGRGILKKAEAELKKCNRSLGSYEIICFHSAADFEKKIGNVKLHMLYSIEGIDNAIPPSEKLHAKGPFVIKNGEKTLTLDEEDLYLAYREWKRLNLEEYVLQELYLLDVPDDKAIKCLGDERKAFDSAYGLSEEDVEGIYRNWMNHQLAVLQS